MAKRIHHNVMLLFKTAVSKLNACSVRFGWIKNSYTLLIIPHEKSSTRKLTASGAILCCVAGMICLVLFSGTRSAFDFVSVQRDISELEALRRLTALQKDQIRSLSAKADMFEGKLKDVRKYEHEVRETIRLSVKSGPLQQLRGVGGFTPSKHVSGSQPEKEMSGTGEKMDRLIEQAERQKKAFAEILTFLEKRKSILSCMPSIWPVSGWVTSGFGYRTSPFTGHREFHGGMDIAARAGKEIVSPANGIIRSVANRPAIGLMIEIDHGYGIRTVYGHLLKSAVSSYARVRRGDVIGYVGDSGRSTGPHLHYLVSLNGLYVNPRRYLP
jgi:murein DD-endopeptidase MepM/ murein hydrolase activator NlpD